MNAEHNRPEQRSRDQQEKLTRLRSLATEAFDEIAQGEGIELSGHQQVDDYIDEIGRRAAIAARRC